MTARQIVFLAHAKEDVVWAVAFREEEKVSGRILTTLENLPDTFSHLFSHQ